MSLPLRVLHLAGSAVSDLYADLSRLYASDCLTATADPERYNTRIAYVAPDRRWHFPDGLTRAAIESAPGHSAAAAIERVSAWRPDVVVPQMFCRPGMTAYRALFDVLGIPYAGNAAETMALGADKARARAVVAAAGVAVPAADLVRPGDRVNRRPPAVIKPVDADNSLGVTLVRDPADYPAALAAAFDHASAALVEDYVPLGREVRCGVLERSGELHCLPLEEYRVDPVHKPIRDRADKLRRRPDGELELVAKTAEHAWIVDPTDPMTAAVHEAARACHRALGCRQYSLFDFRVDPDGRPWFLEAGLYCSFARTSVITVMAAADGIALRELFNDAITDAAGRQERPPW